MTILLAATITLTTVNAVPDRGLTPARAATIALTHQDPDIGSGAEDTGRTRPTDANPTTASVGRPEHIERWRPFAQAWFQPADVEWALDIIDCESDGNPQARNPTSSATGLFQHLATYWPERATHAGIGPQADIYEASNQFAVAAWLYYHGGGPGHWECHR